MARSEKQADPPRFEPGDKVRVRQGVSDPDFGDIALRNREGREGPEFRLIFAPTQTSRRSDNLRKQAPEGYRLREALEGHG